jgi:hypothetical protein
MSALDKLRSNNNITIVEFEVDIEKRKIVVYFQNDEGFISSETYDLIDDILEDLIEEFHVSWNVELAKRIYKREATIYDFISNDRHLISKNELVEFIKELLFAIYHSNDYEGMTYNEKLYDMMKGIQGC